MKKQFAAAIFLAALTMSFAACEKEDSGNEASDPVKDSKPSATIAKADLFAQDVLGSYYLWSKEISGDLSRLNPDTCSSPAAVVEEIRYHENGKEVDHWTTLTDDLESFTNSVQGLGVTYGYDLQYGSISGKTGVYFLLVTYVCKKSPAAAAGLKRGDVIVSLDGAEITKENINNALSSKSITIGVTGIEQGSDGNSYIGSDVKSIKMTAVDMYEDPVLVDTTYDVDGKKVGYLMYNAFDLKSTQVLPDVFRKFKSDGIQDLVLDLRYNGGGYAFTEAVLGSLIAPKSNVDAGDIFQTEVYNSYLADIWKTQGEDTNTYFSNTFSMTSGGASYSGDITDDHPALNKVYVLVTGGTASASEGLIVGLGPYVDLTVIGEQTYGKYCAGYILGPGDFYNSKYDYSLIKDWGIYVMISKFADKNGNNAAIPDGIAPKIAAEDDPFDGCQLGDVNETMLKAALTAAGKVYTKTRGETARQSLPTRPLEHGAGRGFLIKTGDLPSVR